MMRDVRRCCLELKALPTAQQHWPRVSTKEHGNVTPGCATASHTLSRRAGGRLMAAATIPWTMVWQVDASGCQPTPDQARNRFHVTGLIWHWLR